MEVVLLILLVFRVLLVLISCGEMGEVRFIGFFVWYFIGFYDLVLFVINFVLGKFIYGERYV